MFESAEYSTTLSLKLSEVLEDVGINEEMVMKRRRVFMLVESIDYVTNRSIGENVTIHYFGSQSEGTTTLGLKSDMDIMNVDNRFNVIQDWSEWEQNKFNVLMIQDENVTPGYCFLQLLRPDLPLFETNVPDERFIRDSNGRILLRNTFFSDLHENAVQHGPARTLSGNGVYADRDIVNAFPCHSSPQSTLNFVERPGLRRWLSPDAISYVATSGIFVVGTGSKISTYPELEWRISTPLAERCLMYNLNLTQIQCYVMMKYILKSFLDPKNKSALSSFMCKTVMLHCVEKTDQNIWKKNNFHTCLTYCLIEMYSYVQNENCPHFISSENNLMAGQFTDAEKREILHRIENLIQSDGRSWLRIDIDSIGQRLQTKLNIVPLMAYAILDPLHINRKCSFMLYCKLATTYCSQVLSILCYLSTGQTENLKQVIFKLDYYRSHGNRQEQLVIRYLIPFLSSTLGSMMASTKLQHKNPVQNESLKFLLMGLNSDVASGRLKLASVFYCAGFMDKAEFILRQTESHYNCDIVEPVCGCGTHSFTSIPDGFMRKCCEINEDCINHITSNCVKFNKKEVNCVPRELQYEMMRSTREDFPFRTAVEKIWMDLAVVDSLPYLYFLQYKTYGHLHRFQDQQRALRNLAATVMSDANFGHRETTLNLLGQCMEQEHKPKAALQCYILSLQQRERNNAAKFHVCNLLAKYASQMP